MVFDLPTLRALAAGLDEHLRGRSITGVQADSSQLRLSFDGSGDTLRLAYGPPGRLSLSPAGEESARDGPRRRAERFLLGATLVEVTAGARDRFLRLRLERPDRQGVATFGLLFLELIGHRFRAALVSERRRHLLGVWRGRRDRRGGEVGAPYEAPHGNRLLPGCDRPDELAARVGAAAGDSVGRWLTSHLAAATGALARGICHAAGLDPAQPASTLSPDGCLRLWMAAEALYGGAPAKEGWYWCEAGQWHLSVVPCARTQETASQATLVEALRRMDAPPGTSPEDGHLRRVLQRRRRRLQQRRRALADDLAEARQAETCQRHGSLLLSCAGEIAPGASVVELPDPFAGPGQVARIELDPRREASHTATRLLKRARKLQRRRQVLPRRLRDVEEQLQNTEALLDRLATEGGLTVAERLALEEQMDHGVPVAAAPTTARPEPRHGVRPRRYRTSSGWAVWAGRNHRENDTLTHRVAAQNDYWFHAHGYAGSHVVLRRDGRREEPDGRTLEEAAAVAAYWSKGRTARKVPVVYTLAKYVSKPRGAPPGLAVMKREKTLMVRPCLLPEDDAR